jgi:hypothetical protein
LLLLGLSLLLHKHVPDLDVVAQNFLLCYFPEHLLLLE